jgi:hypothetical protein
MQGGTAACAHAADDARYRFRLLVQVEVALSRVLVSMVAVAQTLGEPRWIVLSVGSKIEHLMRHARCVRPEVVTPSRSGGHLRDRAQLFRDGFVQQPPCNSGVPVFIRSDSRADRRCAPAASRYGHLAGTL